jgi:FeS assembly SUF system protein
MDTIAIDQIPEPQAVAAVAPAAIEPVAAPAASSDVALADGATVVDGEPSAIPQGELDAMTELLIERLKTVFDPEIPVDIYELGLIYRVDISDDRDVVVDMTLTAPGCPVAGDMPGWVQDAVEGVQGVRSCNVNLTFDPPWDPSRMSDEAKLMLNMF